jgi:transcriptional regulator with XRE-family HTH domain
LTGSKPPKLGYPLNLETIGDHLRKKRLDLGLLQREVGRKIGVDETTIYNWGKNRSSPSLSYLPKIIKILGYNPYKEEPRTLGEKLLAYRKVRGITQKELAQKLGIDPTTLARWERGEGKPSRSSLGTIDKIFFCHS